MYPEKICANSYMQGLNLVNSMDPQGEDVAEARIRVLRDFLVVTCAQADDPKNPTIIKDIKSLKILYPSGQGCAIDMLPMLDCVISIITSGNPEKNEEMRSLC